MALNSRSNVDNTVRLDGTSDLLLYAEHRYKMHDHNQWPLRCFASVAVNNGKHEVAAEIYGDERGISIAIIDSLKEYAKDAVEPEIKKFGRPPLKVASYFLDHNQKSGFLCGTFAYHAIKQLVRTPESPIPHNDFLSKAELENDGVQFIGISDARGQLPLEFLKPAQEPNSAKDLAGYDTDIVTHRPGKNETTKKRNERVFKTVRVEDPALPGKFIEKTLNFSLQRLRIREYKRVLDIIGALKRDKGDSAVQEFRRLVEQTNPLRPIGWETSPVFSSLIKNGEDLMKGPVQLMREASDSLLQLTPALRIKKICQILEALPTWQSPSLCESAIKAIEDPIKKLPRDSLGPIVALFQQVTDHMSKEPVRWDNKQLLESLNRVREAAVSMKKRTHSPSELDLPQQGGTSTDHSKRRR